MNFIEKKQKGRVPVSTHLTADEYDQYIKLIAGRVTVAEATRQLIQELIKKTKVISEKADI